MAAMRDVRQLEAAHAAAPGAEGTLPEIGSQAVWSEAKKLKTALGSEPGLRGELPASSAEGSPVQGERSSGLERSDRIKAQDSVALAQRAAPPE